MSYVSFKCRAGHVYVWESEFALVVVFVLSECLIKLRQSWPMFNCYMNSHTSCCASDNILLLCCCFSPLGSSH